MRGEPTTFWGKLQSDDSGVRSWHPLPHHCADVAAVTSGLLHLPVWRARLGALAGRRLTDVDIERVSVLAALHDVGKYGLGFQAKGRRDLGMPTAGHVAEGVAAVANGAFPGVLALAAWGDATGSLLLASICHHGKPHSVVHAQSAAWQETWWRPRQGLDPHLGVAELLDRCRHWFPAAFSTAAVEPLPDAAAFGHALAGTVMLADWIGSDTRFFPFSESDDGDRMLRARAQAATALTNMGLDVPPAERQGATDRSAFARVSSYPPRPAQQAVADLPPTLTGSITVLEVDTGSGKTEAALARFVRLFEAGDVDGLYFALPTRSAATQLHRRVYDAARRAFVSPPAVVLAAPGYLRVDDAVGTKLAPFEVLWPDQDRYRHRAWAAEGPKRYLAGCIVVGTVDQVLLSSLMVGHAHMRAASMLRHLLVVDEVHASDAYMTRILVDVLARHRAAGGHALLLSATLGGEARARLVQPDAAPALPSLQEAVATPYPLLAHRDASLTVFAISGHDVDRAVYLDAQPWMESPATLAAAALTAALRGGKVLVVRNTVADCIATQLVVERMAREAGRADLLFSVHGSPAPHHSRFAREDRAALDNELERRVGRHRADGGCVVVATQTVQQSLDLDADLLITDLCPADVLLQRLGRLHRHGRARPSGFAAARAVVAVPSTRDLGVWIGERGPARGPAGLGTVYPDLRILEATWRQIERESVWRTPSMSRRLIEHSLHSHVLRAIVEDGGPRWRVHEIYLVGTLVGQRRLASLNLVDWSTPYDNTSFPEGGSSRIATRLGEDDRRVVFSPPFTGPFGNSVGELVLRGRWAANALPDDLPEIVHSGAGGTRFRFGANEFLYDSLGLRLAAGPADEAADDDGP